MRSCSTRDKLSASMAHAKDKPKVQGGDFVVARNKRASFDYELGQTYEAGIELLGSEVRSMRLHSTDLSDSWVDIDQRKQAWVKGMRIPPLQHAAFGHEEKRNRRLLLHLAEIEQLTSSVDRDGMTIVPTRIYFRGGRVKLEVALARGKKKYDKRQSIKERELDREARSAMRRK